MSVTNNGKQERNKKKKRLIKLTDNCNYPVYPAYAGRHSVASTQKECGQRAEKSRSDRGIGKSSHCNTDTCSYTHTYPNADSYGNTNTCTGKGICFLTRRIIWEPGAVRTAGLRSKLRNSVRSRLPLLIHRQIRKRQSPARQK